MTKNNDFIVDKNYVILRDAYTALDFEFDEATAPAEVVSLVLEAKDLLDDACRIYEDGDDADDTD